MTDGTTGIQVAPITEDDMNKVTSILKRAADAIVGMSQLAADVDMLRATVASLQQDCDRLRNQNNALDEALNHSREMRDNQARELASTKDQLAQVTHDRDFYKSSFDGERANVDKLTAQLAQAKADADQWADEADKHSKAHDAAKAKLDAITSTLGLTPQAMQAPTPTPPVDIVAGSDQSWRSDPSPSSIEPQAPATPVEPSTSTEWQPGYNWDATRQLYVRSTPF